MTILLNYVGQMEKEDNLLFRWLLVKKDAKTYELVTVFSHLIADAASSNVFSKEIVFMLKAKSPVFPILKQTKCRSSQEVNGSPTPFSAS